MGIPNKSAGYVPSDGSNHRASTVGSVVNRMCPIMPASQNNTFNVGILCDVSKDTSVVSFLMT